MQVKALKKVPVLLAGESVQLVPGELYTVSDEIGDALLRGGDAEIVPEAPAKVEEAPVHSRKDACQAPSNKNAGRAPKDK